MSDLITIDENRALALFIDEEQLDKMLREIKEKALAHKPDLETATSRKEIASMAYKVSQSKTLLDKAGKKLVKDWKAKAKKVDASRKKTRDFLDDLRDEVRKPLSEWEEAEKERIAKEKAEEELNQAWDEALTEHELFLRQKAIEEKEAQLAKEAAERKAEQDRIAAEQLAEENRLQAERDRMAAEKEAEEKRIQAERERLEADVAKENRIKEEQKAKEREERLQREAAEKAKKEAEEKAASERLEAESKLQAEKEARKKAERDRVAAEERAKIEQELAVKKAREDAERKAREEKEAAEMAEAKRLAIEKKKAENKAHRKKINNVVLGALVENGIAESVAKDIIILVASGKIPNMSIGY